MLSSVDPNKFKGCRIYIVAGGASLRGIDLENDLSERYVVGCNDAYKLSCTEICVFGDKPWYEKNKNELEVWEGELWTNHSSFDHDPRVNYLRKSPILSNSSNAAAWYGNTGFLALNFVLLGYPDEIVLLGYDMCVVDGRANWHDENRVEPDDETYKTMLLNTHDMARMIDALFPGVRIVNADPLSRLDIFEKVDPRLWGIKIPSGHKYEDEK